MIILLKSRLLTVYWRLILATGLSGSVMQIEFVNLTQQNPKRASET